MSGYVFDYTISPQNDAKVFKDTCNKLQDAFEGFTRKKMLVDVDGTTIQEYLLKQKSIVVYDDYDVGAVYVKSQIELDKLFK